MLILMASIATELTAVQFADLIYFIVFKNLNIDNGRGAYFSNPESISNILSRVTGNNLSNILGTLGVLRKCQLIFN
jgi:filamentous hemagglutinin family protein